MKLFTSHRRTFPDPSLAAADGLVAIGDEMPVERLLEAYSFGIFPWPHEDLPVLWFSPENRGVLDFADLHIARSLARELRDPRYRVTFNRAFKEVLEGCAQSPRPGQTGTWISREVAQAYVDFHHAGYAHSVECWWEGDLVGGLYGVYVGGVFSGESMFYRRDNASKVVLVRLIEALKSNGLKWMDIQMVTDHLGRMGGKYISREDFQHRLKKAQSLAQPLQWPEEKANS